MQASSPSKTQRKRAVEALQALGVRLVALNAEQLAAINLPEDLRAAILEAKRVRSREAHRRQLQYIGRLMREVDPAPIRAKLEQWDGQSLEATAAHHRFERWRERLLEEDGALTEFAREHPGADLQRLRATLREARRERLTGGEPRNFRALFRLIRDAQSRTEAPERTPSP